MSTLETLTLLLVVVAFISVWRFQICSIFQFSLRGHDVRYHLKFLVSTWLIAFIHWWYPELRTTRLLKSYNSLFFIRLSFGSFSFLSVSSHHIPSLPCANSGLRSFPSPCCSRSCLLFALHTVQLLVNRSHCLLFPAFKDNSRPINLPVAE